MLTVLLSLAALCGFQTTPAASPQTPPSVAAITVTPAAPVAEFDLRRLKGQLLRELAWSPDQTELYLQTYDANRDASIKTRYHYLIPVAGGTPTAIDAPPGWAVAYHQWKSAQASPADADWKIEVSTERKIQSATSLPMGGDLARGGSVDPTGGISVETVTAAAAQSGNASIYSMRLSGQVVGEWTNHPIVPGLTFGWAPGRSALIAFADQDGALRIMDRTGANVRVDQSKAVTLPSWSPDGSRLAYLQKSGRSTYAVIVATVTR